MDPFLFGLCHVYASQYVPSCHIYFSDMKLTCLLVILLETASIVDGVVPWIPNFEAHGRDAGTIELALVRGSETDSLAAFVVFTLLLALLEIVVVMHLDEIGISAAEETCQAAGEARPGRTARDSSRGFGGGSLRRGG